MQVHHCLAVGCQLSSRHVCGRVVCGGPCSPMLHICQPRSHKVVQLDFNANNLVRLPSDGRLVVIDVTHIYDLQEEPAPRPAPDCNMSAAANRRGSTQDAASPEVRAAHRWDAGMLSIMHVPDRGWLPPYGLQDRHTRQCVLDASESWRF